MAEAVVAVLAAVAVLAVVAAQALKTARGAAGRLRGGLPRAVVLPACAVLLLGAAAPLASTAAGLTDPTQAPGLAPVAEQGAAAESAERLPSRLQMVIRGPGDSRVAVIDGNLARVGDQLVVDGTPARITRITDGSVQLTRGATRTTLDLLPAAATASARPR